MEKLDRGMQRRVWSRVYGASPAMLREEQQQWVRMALNRAGKNLAFYQQMENHTVYGEAFSRLARETREHIKMLRQILSQ